MNPRQAAFAALVAKRESLANGKPDPCEHETTALDQALAAMLKRLRRLKKARRALNERRVLMAQSKTGRLDWTITHNLGVDVEDALLDYWRAFAAAEHASANLCECQKREAGAADSATGLNE